MLLTLRGGLWTFLANLAHCVPREGTLSFPVPSYLTEIPAVFRKAISSSQEFLFLETYAIQPLDFRPIWSSNQKFWVLMFSLCLQWLSKVFEGNVWALPQLLVNLFIKIGIWENLCIGLFLLLWIHETGKGFLKRSVNFEMSFWCLQFSQKMNKNNSAWGTVVVKSNFFVRFFGELKITKRHFKINWPLASPVSLKEVWYYWCLGAKSAQKELRVCSVVWPLEEKVSLADKIRVHTSVQPFSYKLVATAPSDFVRSKSNKKARTPRNIERWLSDIIS